MRRCFQVIIPLATLLLFPVLAFADEQATQRVFEKELVPLLRTYCYDCHGASDGEGGVSLEADQTAAAIKGNRQVWVRALNQVRLGSMPPADATKLAPETREQLAALINSVANAVDCVRQPNAGKVVMRRLNRNEYRNTVRDLVGVDYEPATEFPGDDSGYGFDNIGDVLSLPPVLMEKYLQAADEISRRAIKTPPPPDLYEKSLAGLSLEGAGRYGVSRGAVSINSRGTVDVAPELPFGGEYVLTVTAFGDQAGDEPCKMEVKLNDKVLEVVDVPASEPADYTIKFRTRPGSHKLELTFINDYYNPDAGADRNLLIVHAKLVGQDSRVRYITSTELPQSHRDIIFVTPGDKNNDEQASRMVLERLMSRAYRRPATDQELDRICRLAAEVRRGGASFDESIQVSMQAILASPHFLFRVEKYREPGPDGASQALNSFELATRLSYFLWSSMPDDALFKSAWNRELEKPQVLRQHVARMLKDSRSNAMVENFAGQWLQLRSLDRIELDPQRFPDFTPEIRQLAKRETLTFFAGVMRNNLPADALIAGDFTYLNEPLAKYYGIPNVKGNDFRQVSLAGTSRGGLLTQASVLSVTSNPTRTSPVKRGKWILENLLNVPPPPPPPNVPELEKGALTGTLREQMEQHRVNPSCAACHNMMDPLGFAMENFDAAGRWRDRDGGQAIDASGELPDGTQFNGVNELRTHLATAKREQFVRCLTEKMMIYALGRGLEYYDRCAVDQIMATAQEKDYRLAYIIAAIVESVPFRSQGER